MKQGRFAHIQFVCISTGYFSFFATNANMDHFNQPLEGIFRDGIPAPVLRAFAPLYQGLPRVQNAVANYRDCHYWRANRFKCLDEDVAVMTVFTQVSEGAFRLCPQQCATLLKCTLTEPSRSLFFCRDEEWEWRSCLTDKAGVTFRPYANAPLGAPFSNGGQTEDFHVEERCLIESMHISRRNHLVNAIRKHELDAVKDRKKWLDTYGGVDFHYPDAKPMAPPQLRADRV